VGSPPPPFFPPSPFSLPPPFSLPRFAPPQGGALATPPPVGFADRGRGGDPRATRPHVTVPEGPHCGGGRDGPFSLSPPRFPPPSSPPLTFLASWTRCSSTSPTDAFFQHIPTVSSRSCSGPPCRRHVGVSRPRCSSPSSSAVPCGMYLWFTPAATPLPHRRCCCRCFSVFA
jgi:hypothetical protein